VFFALDLPLHTTFLDTVPAYLALVALMLLSLQLGQKWGANHRAKGRNTVKEWIGIIDGPILALYGLLLAFTFYGAMQRFDERRRFAVEEATLVSTAFRQTNLLTPADRQILQTKLYRYIESRFALDQTNQDPPALQSRYHQSRELQREIWQEAMSAVNRSGAKPGATDLLATVDQLINLLIRRALIPQFHPPWQVMALFIFLATVASFLAGFQISCLGSKSWPHITLFILILTVVTYLIIDLEYPSAGFIRMAEGQEIRRHLMETITP